MLFLSSQECHYSDIEWELSFWYQYVIKNNICNKIVFVLISMH